MSQLLGKLNFGIASKPRRWFDGSIELVVQLTVDHDALRDAYHVPEVKSAVKTILGAPIRVVAEAPGVRIRNSAARPADIPDELGHQV